MANKITRPTGSSKPDIIQIISAITPEGRDTLKSLMMYRNNLNWDGIQAVPPGSFLEDILTLFQDQTDIPLTLPMMAALCQVSGYLNAKGAHFLLGNSTKAPALWVVVLAASGSGKTFATDTVGNWLKDRNGKVVVPHLPNAASAAQFVDNVAECRKGVWVRDEFGQFLSQMQTQRHMAEMKDVLLRAYSGGPIERMTRTSKVAISDHALTILGITVADTFEQQVGTESLVDGFAQRFNYIVAERDPNRPTEDFPIYFENLSSPKNQETYQRMRKGWETVLDREDLKDGLFTFTEDAIKVFKERFSAFFQDADIPASFFRRTMFSMFSYAVIFHIVAGKPGLNVDQESMSLAARMVAIHLDASRKLLDGYGLSSFEKTLRKAEAFREQFKATGRTLTPRDLISRIREIRNASEARAILAML